MFKIGDKVKIKRNYIELTMKLDDLRIITDNKVGLIYEEIDYKRVYTITDIDEDTDIILDNEYIVYKDVLLRYECVR